MSRQKRTKEETSGEGGGGNLATVLQHLPARAVIVSASRGAKDPYISAKRLYILAMES